MPLEHSEEAAGSGQSLPAAGLLAATAASQAPPSEWLRSFLSRAFTPTSTLTLQHGARNALIEQAVEISTSPNPVKAALQVSDGYLAAANFVPCNAVNLISAFLRADLTNFTCYDSRARETLMRLLTLLHLPPRILYTAEAQLTALIHDIAANAVAHGQNIESVPEDVEHARRRNGIKWLKVGAASVVGGLALGLSGGLIAPALLPALGTVGLTTVSGSLAAFGGGGAVAVGSIFGAAGAGVGAAAMANRNGDVEEFLFERCTILSEPRASQYDSARITPSKKVHEVVLPCKTDDESVVGGLLVWEIFSRQQHAMVVPGRMGFGVQFKRFENDGEPQTREWLLPEEEVDVGGLDESGSGRKRRKTGAITVHGSGLYILRFRLSPSSLSVDLSYRIALVSPGKDPPPWIMEENEEEALDSQKGDVRSLTLAIFVPGLIHAGDNGPYPGMCADQFIPVASSFAKYNIQSFALRWDTKLLVELSEALRRLIGRMALSMAAQNGAMMVVPAVVGAVALPVSIIGAMRTLIGNIWAKTISHASECGYMLAAELASRSFGNRPVVLAGYSAGAMVIFSCLQELARRQLFGIVHDVFLVGTPCTADLKAWRAIRRVVSGRLVNAYNPDDWYLELYHRSTNLSSVAGTKPIQDPEGIANVENICLSNEEVVNHMDYLKRSAAIFLNAGMCDPERRRPWSDTFDPSYIRTEEQVSDREGEHDEDFLTVNHDDYDDVIVYKAVRRANILRRSESTS